MPRVRLTTMGRLIPLTIALLALGCVVRETAGLPWEHVHRALLEPRIQSTAAVSSLSKRGSTLPECPTHPRAVSQAFINQRYMPDRLRKAIANMDASFRSLVEAASIQAASVGLVYDQELIWQQGYGLVDSSDPSSLADENTIYRVGSITKLITNLMLFQLRDQGKLSLDDPVSKYVPELTWPTPYKNNPGITWRTLAGQTSGLTGATPCNFFTLLEPILGDACDISNAEAWKRVTAEQPTAPMWQDPHYADGAYAIIGRALESLVGMSYEDYVHQHIFKPLGMDSSYMGYSAWSDMAKRVPPGKIGNITFPSFVSHVDLNWARPTGNVYSTVKDLAKLVSLFMVGQDERKNALGIYSSTLREMLTSSFINDEQTTAYGYPFEVYHSSAFGQGLPPYWVRVKAGSMPGYFTILVFFPEVKTALILQSSGFVMPWAEAIAEVLPAIDQSLWELRPLPTTQATSPATLGSIWPPFSAD